MVDDRYEILREIGRGAHSCVYEALDTNTDARVALKLLRPPAATFHLVRERLRDALGRIASLDHPAVVRARRVFDWDGCIAVESELVSGRDLEAWVSNEGVLDPEHACEVARDLAGALAAVHETGLVHRNLKPRNILLDEEGRARLLDLGGPRLDAESSADSTETVDDAVAFLAPEIVAGRSVDPRTDIYALGMTLYFALVGRVPPRPTAQLPPPPRAAGYRPRERRPDLPVWLDELIGRATSAEPHQRYPSAPELLAAVDARRVQIREGADPQLLHICVLCREPGALGRAVCPHCEDDPAAAADTLVLLEAPGSRAVHRQRRRALAGLTDDAPGSARVGRAAAGDLPVLRVSRRQARRVAQRLAAHGLPSRLVASRESWAAIPRPALRLSAALAVGGLAAGAVGQPAALAALLFLAALVIPGAALQTRSQALLPRRSGPRASRALVQRVTEVVPHADTGDARQLLVEALRLGRSLQLRLRHDAGALEALDATLLAACDAARELAGIDSVLQALDLHGEHSDEPPAGLLESRSLYEAARGCIVQSLMDTTAALSQLHAAEMLMLDGDRAAELLRARADELCDDAQIAAQMAKEALGIFSAAGG